MSDETNTPEEQLLSPLELERLVRFAHAGTVLPELLRSIKAHTAALTDYFSEYGANHEDGCPEDDTCSCKLIEPIRAATTRMNRAIELAGDRLRHVPPKKVG